MQRHPALLVFVLMMAARPADGVVADEGFRAGVIGGTAPGRRLTYNTLEGFRSSFRAGVRTVEGDFRLTRDGVLVATHDDPMRGDCGRVSRRTLAELRRCRMDGYRVAALDDVLEIAFDEIYLDLKDTHQQGNPTWNPATAQAAVTAAIDAIEAHGRAADVVVMIYDASAELTDAMRAAAIRGGFKGYPRTSAAADAMTDTAAAAGLELVCINVRWITPAVLVRARTLGVWHLGWDVNPPGVLRWRARAAAGMRGLITQYYRIVVEKVAPAYQPDPQGTLPATAAPLPP